MSIFDQMGEAVAFAREQVESLSNAYYRPLPAFNSVNMDLGEALGSGLDAGSDVVDFSNMDFTGGIEQQISDAMQNLAFSLREGVANGTVAPQDAAQAMTDAWASVGVSVSLDPNDPDASDPRYGGTYDQNGLITIVPITQEQQAARQEETVSLEPDPDLTGATPVTVPAQQTIEEQIREYVGREGVTANDVVAEMDAANISVQQVADALGVPVKDVQSQYDQVTRGTTAANPWQFDGEKLVNVYNGEIINVNTTEGLTQGQFYNDVKAQEVFGNYQRQQCLFRGYQ